MRNFATATTFAALIFAGTATMADNTFPCGKAQFWITSLPTVPAGAEMHKSNYQVNIAAAVLQSRIRVAKEKHQELVAAR